MQSMAVLEGTRFDVNNDLKFKELNMATDLKKEEVQKTALAVSYAILEGRWNDLDGLLDDNFTFTGDGLVLTKDEYMGFMQDMKAAFSNLEMEFPHILVDGDQASIRFISKAVNTGSFMGAPANKKNLEIHGIFIRKVKNGKVMQEWQSTDLLGVMTQIGFGALFGYALFVGLFKVKQKRPVRKQ
jgi:predicted ester cyclase